MITRVESMLSAAEYANIQADTGSLSAQIVLQRYGPSWAAHPDTSGSGRTGSCFDAISIADYLLRAYGDTASQISAEYLASEVSGVDEAAWTYVDCTAIINLDTDIPLSIVSDSGNAVRMFYVNTIGGLAYSDCANIGTVPFGAGTVIGTPSDPIIYLAAVTTLLVYYITETDNNSRVFHYYEYDGSSWSSTDSDVYWPFPIHGFDAVGMSNDDLLIIATDLAPLIGSRAVGAEVQAEINRVQALVTFRCTNDRFSDWQQIDPIDRIPENYPTARRYVRLSQNDGILFATYNRAGGADGEDGTYEYTKSAVCRSKDGDNWEFPEFVDDVTAPFAILPYDEDYLYAVGINATLRSHSCAWGGQEPVEYDVTDYVLQQDSSAADIRNSSVALADPPTSLATLFSGTLAGTLVHTDDRLRLRYDLGYIIDGSAVRTTVSTEDLIARQERRTYEKLHTLFQSQDVLGRVNRVRADGAFEWPSQQAGRDAYNDPTGTGYGGLRHTAPYDGSWKGSAGQCQLVSSNMEGVAISTFVTDALNGSAQTGIKLGTASQGEYAGIAFHILDKDNLFFVAYYLDEDEIKLYSRSGGTDTVLAESGNNSISWGSVDTWYYLKVLVRYSLVYVYTSADGITWSTLTAGDFSGGYIELEGNVDEVALSLRAWSGKFGLIGYGYSDTDEWPPWPPQPIPPPIPTEPEPTIGYVRGDDGDDRIWRTADWGTGAAAGPTWVDVTGTLLTKTIYRIGIDQANWYVYAQCDDGLYKANVNTTTPVWTRKLDPSVPPTGTEWVWERDMAITADGYVGIYARSSICAGTSNWICKADGKRPALIVLDPDSNVTVYQSDLACTYCCPTHAHAWPYPEVDWFYGTSPAWGQWSMFAVDQTITMPMSCYYSGHRNVHLAKWGVGDSAYTMTNEGSHTTTYATVGQGVDMDSVHIGFVNVSDPDTVYSIIPGCGNGVEYTDISHADMDLGTILSPTMYGFDRDALLPYCVVTDDDRLFGSDGGAFTELLDRADITNLGQLRHCSCYAGDSRQLFLAAESGVGTNGAILWTLNRGNTWISRLGNLAATDDYKEIRVVWTKEPV